MRIGLAGAGAGALLPMALPAFAGLPPSPRPNLTVLHGINAATSAAQLEAVLDTFLSLGLPVACVVDNDRSHGDALTPDHPISHLLADRFTRFSTVLECVAFERDLLKLTPYDMARAAYNRRSALVAALFGDTPPPRFLSTIACNAQANTLAPEGLRSAGFQTCLVIGEESGAVTSEIWKSGTLRLFGGRHIALAGAVDVLGNNDTQFANICHLSLEDIAAQPVEQAAHHAASYARIALDHEIEGEVSNMPLSDLIFRDDFGYQRSIGLHLYQPPAGDPEAMARFDDLMAGISNLGFAFSIGALPKANPKDAPSYWVGETDQGPELIADENAPNTPGFGVVLTTALQHDQGVDDRGFLRLPTFPVTLENGGVSSALKWNNLTTDIVLTIDPQSAATAQSRTEINRMLQQLDQDGVSHFVPVSELAAKRYPTSNLITRFQRVQALTPAMRAGRASAWDKMRADYMDDAQLAWRYIENYTSPISGLCASLYDGTKMLETVTMWDVASHLNALVAAETLGLIDRAEYRKKIAKIMPNLQGKASGDRVLPREWLRTDQVRWGHRNFNACDTGRLLACFTNLKDHDGAHFDPAEVVEGWTLDKVLINGEVHSVVGGEMYSSIGSHCAHYTARAFRAWGFDVNSPYEVFDGQSAADGRMRLLHAANRVGILGAEPLLMEASDFGLSEESGYLADVLFAAQLRAFLADGRMYCVSESPLNRRPWFTYQGLSMNELEREWVVEPTDANAKFRTPEFQDKAISVSSKAAYLWAAHRPHEFTDQLVKHVRENGKTQYGFSSGIFMHNGQAMRNYTDLNTNGVILQSIAKIMARDAAP